MYCIKTPNILINNENLTNSYTLYSNVFAGTKTYNDALYLLDKLELSVSEKNMIISLINSKKVDKFVNKLDFKTLINTIKDINKSKYREEANLKINTILKNTNDIAQIKTLTRIANILPLKPSSVPLSEIITNKIEYEKKKCPHCAKELAYPKNTEYVICGFGENSYDWEGCCKDWCFKCGKILCKSWDDDQLFVPFNQIHDSECCKKHSLNNKKKYPKEYCQCINDHVQRDKVIDFYK
jgi:hypothetical protein